MCGLTGFLDLSPRQNAQALITAMTRQLHHRGPDASDVWTSEEIALGHRRLAIVDLSVAGAQPMHSACGKHVLVFNGEIYNHADLRCDLEAARVAPVWRGHSDTETLLASILHWGIDETLSRAAGMFALAHWDIAQRRLSLARDRIGEKPLYWGWAGATLVFGSELKALRPHPGFPANIDRGALAQYLRFGYVPAPRSIHPGIYKLEPGCILEASGDIPARPPKAPLRPGDSHGGISLRRYWSLNDEITKGNHNAFRSETEGMKALEQALEQAVSRQMVADVPLGAFLSGGIDSSLIVALMQKQAARPVQTYTIGFEKAGFNEAPHAAAVARHLGTNHTELTVSEAETRAVIPMLPALYDEPFADSSQIPTYLVCQAARRHVTVALSGDAGDELFGGYNRYFWGPRIWNRLGRLPQPLRRGLGATLTALPVGGWDRIGALAGRIGGPKVSRPGDKIHKLAARLSAPRSFDDFYRSLVSEWDPAELVGQGDPPSQLDDPLPDVLANAPAARMMALDMRSYLPDDILCKVDRAAMGVSLETRVPFLDPEVVAVSTRLPMDMKVRDGQGKWALRQILYRHVPREVIERPKTGFSIPVGDWLRGPLRPWAEDLLSFDRLARDGLLDPAPICRIWAEHLSGRRDWTPRLWIILMFQAWLAIQSPPTAGMSGTMPHDG